MQTSYIVEHDYEGYLVGFPIVCQSHAVQFEDIELLHRSYFSTVSLSPHNLLYLIELVEGLERCEVVDINAEYLVAHLA